MANTISTSTNANATAYSAGQLVAVSASGDALVVWYDGSNVKWSYASSPYSSWTTASLITSISGRWEASLYKLSNDNALLVCSNGSGNMVSYLFTYSSGSHNWSAGSAVTVLSSGGAFNGGSVAMDIDAQGRIWAAWSNNSHVVQIKYTTDNGSTWTASTTFTQVSGGDDTCVNLAYCGNYIVVAFCGASAVWKYARIDAHSASLGSWSSATTISNCTMDNTVTSTCLRGAPGSNYGILCGDFGSIPTQNYNATTDTWSSVTSIGSSSDKTPTLVTDGTDLYCVWSKFSASNNFSLVYKKWVASTQTWDSASTQLEANGTNIARASGGYGNSTLGFVYTVGTASPWNVNFDTKAFSTSTQVIKDSSTRFRLMSANQLKDMASRLRLRSADQLKDSATRLRLRSANLLKDTVTRLRLRSADTLRDTSTRLRLRSADQLKDAITRLRLRSADLLKDSVTRLRLRSADQTRDTATRLNLALFRDTITRLRLKSADLLKDTAARFLLRSADQLQDSASRFRLMSASQAKDTASRLLLRSANILRDTATRFLLRSADTLKDTSVRLRLMSSTLFKGTSTRVRLRSADQLRDTPIRLRLRSADQLKDLVVRFCLKAEIASQRDLSTRFLLRLSAPVVNATLIVSSGQGSVLVASGHETALVSSGQMTATLTSGQATNIIRSGEATLIKRS